MKSFWTLLFAVVFGFAVVGCEDRRVEPEGEVAPVPEGDTGIGEPGGAEIGAPAGTETPPAGGAMEAPGAAETPGTTGTPGAAGTPGAGDAAVKEEPVTSPPPELKEEAKQ